MAGPFCGSSLCRLEFGGHAFAAGGETFLPAGALVTTIGLYGGPAEKLLTPGLTPERYRSAVRVAAADLATGHPVDIHLGRPDQVEQYAATRKIRANREP
ncbi:hypothetical protein BN6_06810 [Saccharothrix espanaensis DSM 44229]|uniref:Uncharacterized protein n=1 Tax=Saccharothrix espanaensis (strain ATCC 51144 / DSM 44229 / JCM 9112 / NBRC 15066 / NRRL 15764) TaxID=1179773 RepID=K0JT52_SACES|nr:hypothetical protein BN6_06810 [Saccharothrix espanaensis DSM 44229]